MIRIGGMLLGKGRVNYSHSVIYLIRSASMKAKLIFKETGVNLELDYWEPEISISDRERKGGEEKS